MKALFHELGEHDEKAKRHFAESLAVCAQDHLLSRKLLNRLSNSTGPMYAIVGHWFDLATLTTYDYTVLAPSGTSPIADGERARDRLVAFIREYLLTTQGAAVISENWGAEQHHIEKWAWRPPRVACFGDNEVYHILTPDITDPEMIEAAIVARHHWQTGVCFTCSIVPAGDIPDESFLDEIVDHTRHLFIPAFDGSGYLIWSPG